MKFGASSADLLNRPSGTGRTARRAAPHAAPPVTPHVTPHVTPRVTPHVTRYARVAIVLHWLTAALVLLTIPLGWFSAAAPPRMQTQLQAQTQLQTPAQPPAAAVQKSPRAQPPVPPPKSAAQQAATNLHKTVGVVILFLTALRIGWRLTHKPPALPERMARPLRWLARASHALFYLLLVVMPLSGWWMSSAVPNPRRHAFGFGIFDIPFLPVPQSWAAAGAAKVVHTSLVWLMVALVLLHIAAALKHHIIDKDGVLQRMLPHKS